MISIYTDGACVGNPGPGGWAAIIVQDGGKHALSGREEKTTNNRMELLAAIKGLDATTQSSEVTVYSDSQYLVNTMTRGWKKKANQDLWARLDEAVKRRRVEWQWVRGHVGHPENEEADALARREAGSLPPQGTLTHLDESGRARMVDIGWKLDTERVSVAKGSVLMKKGTLELIKVGGLEKGDVLGVARIAGVMGAKNTPNLIPLCHPIPLNQVTLDFELDENKAAVHITATAKATAKTGVEMEAMIAVMTAALTIYDMCKAVDRAMKIEGVRLIRKSGGKSGDIVLENS